MAGLRFNSRGVIKMTETAAIAFATFFVTVGPIETAVMFAALSAGNSAASRRSTAILGVAVAAGILLLFAVFGDSLLSSLGISLAALRAAGGVLFLLMGVDMVFARNSGATSATADEKREAIAKDDIAVFPLATPFIAGPGAIGAVILLSADASGDFRKQITVLLSLALVLLIQLALLLVAGQVRRLLGVTGMNVVTRIFGVILSALAMQFIFDGIAESGLINGGGGG